MCHPLAKMLQLFLHIREREFLVVQLTLRGHPQSFRWAPRSQVDGLGWESSGLIPTSHCPVAFLSGR